MKVKIIILMVLILLFTIFVMQNTQPVEVNAFFWHKPLPLIVLMIILVMVGIIIGFIVTGLANKSAKKKENLIAEQKKQEENKEIVSKNLK